MRLTLLNLAGRKKYGVEWEPYQIEPPVHFQTQNAWMSPRSGAKQTLDPIEEREPTPLEPSAIENGTAAEEESEREMMSS